MLVACLLAASQVWQSTIFLCYPFSWYNNILMMFNGHLGIKGSHVPLYQVVQKTLESQVDELKDCSVS